MYPREVEDNKELEEARQHLYNPKTQKYKRVLSSPLRYAGGKSLAVGHILEHLPKLKERKIISPFMGGGSFELFMAQAGYEVVCYDIFGMLCNFWKVVFDLKTRKEFIKHLETFDITRDEFELNRHILLHFWNKIKPPSLVYNSRDKIALTETQQTLLDHNVVLQSVYYYYNMTLSYGPMFLGWPSSNELKPEKFRRKLEKLYALDTRSITISCAPFEEVIDLHVDDFLFLDPPYYLGTDSKMFKGMYPNCNFAIHHKNFNHALLRDKLYAHRGGFLLTYNDCPTLREWYKDFIQVFPEWQYTFGQGETRVGKNRESTQEEVKHIKSSHEMFIICPPLSG